MTKIKYNDVPFIPSADCSHYEDCQADAYQQGREDMKMDFIGMLEREFSMQNNPNSKCAETIVLRRNFLEQLKENKNE